MTTFVAFVPTATTPPFQATVTLDSAQYSLSAWWNMYRGDWYYTLTDQAQTVVITAALIGSPPDSDILLAPGIFAASTLIYRPSTGYFEITP